MSVKHKYCFKAHVEEMRQGIPHSLYADYIEAYEKRFGPMPEKIKDCDFYSHLEYLTTFSCNIPKDIEKYFDTDLLFRLIVGSYNSNHEILFNKGEAKPFWATVITYLDTKDALDGKGVFYSSTTLKSNEALSIIKYCIFDLIRHQTLLYPEDPNIVKLACLKIDSLKDFKANLPNYRLKLATNKAKEAIDRVLRK